MFNSTANPNTKAYFWRTYDAAEIDLVEEYNGNLKAFEFKLNPRARAKIPQSFTNKYNPLTNKIISPSNLFEVLDES
jgi:hypothetical protein